MEHKDLLEHNKTNDTIKNKKGSKQAIAWAETMLCPRVSLNTTACQ